MKTLDLAVLLALASALPALADQKLAESKNCLACHSVKEKIVGPSFRDVAAKYAGQADAPKMLAERIQKGSSGVWGSGMAMPPNAVTPEEATTLANWVLAQK
jgi:cytochrome c